MLTVLFVTWLIGVPLNVGFFAQAEKWKNKLPEPTYHGYTFIAALIWPVIWLMALGLGMAERLCEKADAG